MVHALRTRNATWISCRDSIELDYELYRARQSDFLSKASPESLVHVAGNEYLSTVVRESRALDTRSPGGACNLPFWNVLRDIG
jgi:hypothetical protein